MFTHESISARATRPVNSTALWKLEDFSGSQSAVTYAVKVVIFQKWCKTDTLLPQTTNRKWHTTHPTMHFRWPGDWSDLQLQGHSPLASLCKTLFLFSSATNDKISTDTAHRSATGLLVLTGAKHFSPSATCVRKHTRITWRYFFTQYHFGKIPVIHRVKWRHISVVAIRSPFCRLVS